MNNKNLKQFCGHLEKKLVKTTNEKQKIKLLKFLERNNNFWKKL